MSVVREPGPGIWWVLAALVAAAAVLGFVMSLPVEVVGVLLVVASLAVLAAGLATRSRRVARWRSFDDPPRGGRWPR
jgi:hypothetical protein